MPWGSRASRGSAGYPRLQGPTRRLAPPQFVGTDYTQDISDLLGLVDSSQSPVDYRRPQSDLEGLLDPITWAATYVRNPGTAVDADGLGIADSVQRLVAYQRPTTDAEGLLDATQQIQHPVRLIIDLEGMVDSVSGVASYVRVSSDQMGMVDSATDIAAFFRSTTDPEGMLDSVTRAVAYVRNPGTAVDADGLGLLDSATRVAAYSRSATDPEGLLDSVLRALTRTLGADGLGLTDSVLRALGRSITDTLGLLDPRQSIGTHRRLMTDPEGMLDSAASGMAAARIITDLEHLGDGLVAQDDFGRVGANSWGGVEYLFATGSPTWALIGGAPANFSVNGSTGIITVITNATPRAAQISALALGNSEILFKVQTDKLAVGASQVVRAVLRSDATLDNAVIASVLFNTDQSISTQFTENVAGVASSSSIVQIAGLTHAAATFFWIRARILGQTLRVKVWQDGSSEPADWTRSIPNIVGTTPGSPAVQVQNQGGTTNVPIAYAFSALKVYDLSSLAQQLAAVRSPTDLEGLSDAALLRQVASIRGIIDAEGMTDSVLRGLTRVITDILPIPSTGTVVGGYARSLTNPLGLTDSIAKALGKVITDAEGMVDSSSYTLLVVTLRLITDSMGLSDQMTKVSSMSRPITDPEGLTDSLARATTKVFTDAMQLFDSDLVRASAVPRTFTDPLGAVDSTLKAIGKLATDALGLADSAAAVKAVARTFSDAEGVHDQALKALGKTVTDALALHDAAARLAHVQRTAADALGLTDSRSAAGSRSVTDHLGIVDQTQRKYDARRILVNVVAASDSLARALARIVTDVEALSDSRPLSLSREITDVLGLIDSVERAIRLFHEEDLADYELVGVDERLEPSGATARSMPPGQGTGAQERPSQQGGATSRRPGVTTTHAAERRP